ncbi:hypothetical protein AGMMS49975_29010 [Clostridia bacterium]|nr:hypothetical protein AGMMS49975_29010 [Clostridia bacterium]
MRKNSIYKTEKSEAVRKRVKFKSIAILAGIIVIIAIAGCSPKPKTTPEPKTSVDPPTPTATESTEVPKPVDYSQGYLKY